MNQNTKTFSDILNYVKSWWLEHSGTAITIDRQGNINYSQASLTYTPWSKYSQAEIDGRMKFVESFFSGGGDSCCITLMPLYSPYDLFLYGPQDYGMIELKERTKKWPEVMMEETKWTEAITQGYSHYFFYSNIFSDGDIYSWYPKELDLTPSVVMCNRSTVEEKGKKPKNVYLLPLEQRRKGLDMHFHSL